MKVIIAAGGSGGHIFPAVALASDLERCGIEGISFVSSKRKLDRNILKGLKYPCSFLSVNPMPLKFDVIRIFAFLGKLVMDAFLSLWIIARVRPSVVVGFGGYSSGAIVLMSKLFNIPIVIHEQNLIPGRANLLLSRIADRIAVSFKDSYRYFDKKRDRVVYTGNPLRTSMLANDRERSISCMGLDSGKKTVLIMGGSQGSSFLNSEASESARIVREECGDIVQFIHLTGKKDYAKVKDFYKINNMPGKVFSFLDRIDEAYAVSDVAVSRSGAAAVFELAYYSIPMVLVPYPNPKNNQRHNAVYFDNNGAAICREEKNLTAEILACDMIKILNDKNISEQMAEAASRLSVPDAGLTLAEETINTAIRR